MRWNYMVSKIIKKLHLPAIKNSNINVKAKVCSGSHVVSSKIGKYTYVGNFCTVVNVDIGSFCSIADNCIIGGASHPTDWVSTSPVFHKGKNVMKKNFSKHEYITTQRTNIKNDVWIGNNCLIKSGVRIGNGAIIGMGSVLIKDVGDYEIWAGNPARLIRKRFNDELIEEMIRSNWWEWNEERLSKAASFFNQPKQLHEYLVRGD